MHDIGKLVMETGTFEALQSMAKARRASAADYSVLQENVDILIAKVM
jgi:hypothetical protein